jgi:hypothetical protein
MSFWIAGATVVSAAVGAYGAYESNQTGKKALGLAEDTQGKQDYYNQQLMQLMANPDTFLSSDIFKSTLAVGTQGVNRSMAAQGFLGSGNQATALEQYGQSLASQQLLGQEQLLGSLSGAGSASSPSQALGTATSGFGQSFNQLGSLLASLGYSAGGMGGGSAAVGNSMQPGVESTVAGMNQGGLAGFTL